MIQMQVMNMFHGLKRKMLDDLFKAQKNLQKPVYEIIFVVIIQKKTVFFLEFLGLDHIGNIKYEPLTLKKSSNGFLLEMNQTGVKGLERNNKINLFIDEK